MAYWLDDGFDTWPEVVRAGKAATGLYVCCGAWISRALTDGFVPAEIAAMYGTPEWVTKLVAVGLWSTEGAGYQDLHYFRMGNPTAEKVRARRQADADRKARWRERKHQSRRDPTRDSARNHSGTDGVTPLSPALPPSKEGQGRTPARAPGGAARAPQTQDPGPTFLDDPVQLAQHRAEVARAAEEGTRAIQQQRDRTRSGAALARQALAAKRPPPPAAEPPEGAL